MHALKANLVEDVEHERAPPRIIVTQLVEVTPIIAHRIERIGRGALQRSRRAESQELMRTANCFGDRLWRDRPTDFPSS